MGRSVGRGEGNVGSMGRCWKMLGRCGKVCWNVGEVLVVWVNMGRCVWGVARDVENVLGWGEVRSVGRGGGVGRCWERSR